MDQGLIPRRYAKALLMFANEHGSAAAVYDAARRLCQAFKDEPSLQRTLSNPYVSVADKEKLVKEAAAPKGQAEKDLDDFIKLLEKNHRTDFLHHCALEYIALYRRENKIYSVTITSAAPMEPSELKRIHQIVEKHLPEGATAEFREELNPELIGGFTVAIDNDLLDASVATELKQLRLKLLSH